MKAELRWSTVRRALGAAFGVVALGLGIGCAGYATVDGYDAAYVDAPPVGIYGYPRYPFHDGYIYDVHGRYYHEHGGRWVAYRHAPREVSHYARR